MRTKLLALTCCVLAWSALSRADEPQPPKPGPEHEALKKLVGEWDAVTSIMGKEEKGSCVTKLGFGGFWLTQEFTSTFGAQKFEGRATVGYDPIKKKYMSTWIDSMSPTLLVLEGMFDKESGKYTETGEGVGMDGKPEKVKIVSEFKDKDTYVSTFYSVIDGKDQEMMKITYTRKK
jgi:hypothetical protein